MLPKVLLTGHFIRVTTEKHLFTPSLSCALTIPQACSTISLAHTLILHLHGSENICICRVCTIDGATFYTKC